MIPSTPRNVVEQRKMDIDRPSSSRARSERKTKVDDSQKNMDLPVDTLSIASDLHNDTAVKQLHHISGFHNNINNNHVLHQSDLASFQLTDLVCYRPVSQQKIESSNLASPSYSDVSKRRISVAMQSQYGTVESRQFTVNSAKCDVARQTDLGVFVVASENTECGSISQCDTSELQTLLPENAPVMVKQHKSNVTSNLGQSVTPHSCQGPVRIKVEKRLLSKTPMTICTLPVPRPAFVCKSILPETTSAKPNFSSASTCARSYHETTRSKQCENLPLSESGHNAKQRRSGTISRLPYVGADLWELTTQRLQHAIIDKVVNGPQNDEKNNAGCEDNSRSSSNTEHSPNIKKCLSAKTFRPKAEMAIRPSLSTSHLQQNCTEDDKDEAIGDCNIEL